MNFFKNLSIFGKFISVVLLILLLETAIAISSTYFLNRENANLNAIVDQDAEKIKLAARIDRNLVEIHRTEKNMLLSRTKEAIERYSSSISGYKKELEDRFARLKKLVDVEDKALLSQFSKNYQEFIRINSYIESLVFHGFVLSPNVEHEHSASSPVLLTSEAITLSQGKGREAFNRASEAVEKLVDMTDAGLETSKASSDRSFQTALTVVVALGVFSIVIGLILGLLVSRSISNGMNSMVSVADAIAGGDLETPIEINRKDEIGKLSVSVSEMQKALKRSRDESADQNWLKTGIVSLNGVMLGETELSSLGNNVITEIATFLDAKVGAFYLTEDREKEPVLSLLGSYAYMERKNLSNTFKFGEGLVGQSAREKKRILVSNVPEDYIKVVSGLGESSPRFISVIPFLYENQVMGVVEIGFLDQPTDLQIAYLDQAMSAIAINFETVQGREQLAKALAQSQTLAEELETQQEELRATNEELEEQTQALEESEHKLKAQQEELEVANEELREKNESLEQQKREIEVTRKAMEEKAEELAIAGKYKSEFLANMSHELRTPLNSLLLLSSILAENKEGNLTEDQLESTRVVYQSGNDLLSLINEILDLSKIESGKMELQAEDLLIKDLAESLMANFQHMADNKGLRLAVNISENTPADIHADRKRVEQIMKNLLSNAIKFSEKGSVTVDFSRPAGDVDLSRSGLDRKNAIAIAVKDTGIGMSPEDQKIVFEAFQQAEGGTARQYGGTGLGLSISRELARLLGGEIQMESEVGKGSVFTLYLPIKVEETRRSEVGALERGTVFPSPVPSSELRTPPSIEDDRDSIAADEKAILVIEDDPKFARLLLKLCHERGLKCLATPFGEEGLELAEKYLPEAIILDIKLPGIDGWTVLETLKENPKIRHIPVHIMSVEEPTMEAFRKGAIGYLQKPVKKEDLEAAFHKLDNVSSKEVKNLLVVEDDENLRKGIIKLIGNGDVCAEEAANGEETIRALKSKTFDCMILDLGLPDMTGFQLLKVLEAEEDVTIPPVIVHTGRELTREEDAQLREYAESIIIKGVKSEERLLDEASLFLHRVVSKMPEKKRHMITSLHDTDAMFKDKTVLVVDDDMRNVFALSRVLAGKGMRVLKAENGQKALDILKDTPVVDLVLMDIMMPVMDGYETMKRIRAQETFRKLPVIALTAKAMKEDKTRCIAAGASDYLPKPVDVNRLSSMMRVWLYR